MKALFYLSIFVFLSACAEHKETPEVGLLNKQATLPAGFDFSKRNLKVIASTVNKNLGTMSTLYGNDAAMATARENEGKCLPGTVYALVTWKQQADKRWIGGNIPGALSLVEVLQQSAGQQEQPATYTRYKGSQLLPDSDTAGQTARTKFILSLKPSIMF